MRLVLASTSPRRRELLTLLEVPFEVSPPMCDEMILRQRSAGHLAAEFSKAKAHAVAGQNREALVLASDTLIQSDDRPFGKPRDLEEARAMLQRLSGRVHEVKTAVTAVCQDRRFERTEVATARVRMKPLDLHALEHYLTTGDSLGKAGAYSIQGPGAELIERLEGDFTTVVGFPLRVVAQLLMQGGVTIPVDVDSLYARRPYDNWSRFPG